MNGVIGGTGGWRRTLSVPLLACALFAGGSYWLAALQGWSAPAWKGAGVALLALWAANNARRWEGWAITVALALGAAGDVLLEVAGLRVGAVAFFAGHLIATTLFLSRRTSNRVAGAFAFTLAFAIVTTATFLTRDAGVAVYAVALGAMTGSAWGSRWGPAVTLGALAFAASDLLIFARMGGGLAPETGRVLIWPLYFFGQAAIGWGIVRRLDREGTA